MKSHKKSNKINSVEAIVSRCVARHSNSNEGVSGCFERASGCTRLPALEQRTKRWKSLQILILTAPFEGKLGRTSPNDARINDKTNKRIETQEIKGFD